MEDPPQPLLRGSRGRYPDDRAEIVQLVVALEDICFGDESGINADADFCVVAGWMGSPRQWKKFDAAWREVLEKSDVPAFHSKEFFQIASHQSSKSPYSGWSHGRLTTFMQELLRIISWHQIVPVGAVVDVQHWKHASHDIRAFTSGAPIHFETKPGGIRPWLDDDQYPDEAPYFPAFTRMVLHAATLIRPTAHLQVIMDRNSTYGPLAERLIWQNKDWGAQWLERVNEIRWRDDEEFPGIQAADMLANVMHTFCTSRKTTSFYDLAHAAFVEKGSLNMLIVDHDSLMHDLQKANTDLFPRVGKLIWKQRGQSDG